MRENKFHKKKNIFIRVGRVVITLICLSLFLMAGEILFKIKTGSIYNNIALNTPEKLNNLRAYFPLKNDIKDYGKYNSILTGGVNIETDEVSKYTGFFIGSKDNKFPSRIFLNTPTYDAMTMAFGFVIKKIYKNYDYEKNLRLIEYPIISTNSYLDNHSNFKITYAPVHNTLYIYFSGKKMLLNDVSLNRLEYYFILMTYNPSKNKLAIYINGIKTGGKYMPSNIVSKTMDLPSNIKIKPFDEMSICADRITKYCAEFYINELTVWGRELSAVEIKKITHNSIKTTKSDANKIITDYMQIIFLRIAIIIIVLVFNRQYALTLFKKIFMSTRLFIKQSLVGAINTCDRRDWEELAIDLGINANGMGEHELVILILNKYFPGENYVNCSFDYVKGRVDQIVKSKEFGC